MMGEGGRSVIGAARAVRCASRPVADLPDLAARLEARPRWLAS